MKILLSRRVKAICRVAICGVLILVLSACNLPRVTAEERTFLDLSVEFLGEYQLSETSFEDTRIGGLSGITYNRQADRFYAISDDRSVFAPARFYTLKLNLNANSTGEVNFQNVDVEGVTFLKNEQGESYPLGSIDAEGIALSPRGSLYISSEGSPRIGVNPFIGEFDLQTGQLLKKIPLPERFLPNDAQEEPRGIQENLGFEALTLNPTGLLPDDPFRIFTATESALLQDKTEDNPEEAARIRFLHYTIGPIGSPALLAEHLYLLEPTPPVTFNHGLVELTALEQEGFFLSLERRLGLEGFGVQLFQMVVGNATDTSGVKSFAGELGQLQPLKKQLLLNLNELGIYIDNLEGMTLGPRLPDGSQSLILVSDNNFNENQVTQFLLFRLTPNKA